MESSDDEEFEDYANFLDLLDSTSNSLRAAASAAIRLIDMDSSGDEEEEEEIRDWGGSLPGKAPNKKRDFELAYRLVVDKYFNALSSVLSSIL